MAYYTVARAFKNADYGFISSTIDKYFLRATNQIEMARFEEVPKSQGFYYLCTHCLGVAY